MKANEDGSLFIVERGEGGGSGVEVTSRKLSGVGEGE
jgi:hypothetical protein